MTPPPSSAILPALSIAIGLPLTSTRRDASSSRAVVESSLPSREARRRSSSSSTTARMKNNVSRLYARRIMDDAELERSHPWLMSSSERDSDGGERRRRSVRRDETTTPPECNDGSGGGWRRSADRLLTEALSALIDVKYPEQANPSTKSPLLPVSLLPSAATTRCESSSSPFAFPSGSKHDARSRTLNAYNELRTSSGGASDKPREWESDVDLEQRRARFGREISPLSDTSRLERWGMAMGRMGTLGLLVAPLGVLVPLNWVLGGLSSGANKSKASSDGSDDKATSTASTMRHCYETVTQKTWDYALWAVETAGPTYIKLAQWASTRNDLFSPEFVGHFAKLQDETRGHSWNETEMSLERAYGKEWRKVLSFETFDEDHSHDSEDNRRFKGNGDAANRDRQRRLQKNETAAAMSSSPTIPIGSGCVAQVYKARLRQSHGLHPAGTSVAVKVQHPRILEKVCLDFYIMNKFASLLEYIPYLNLDYLSMKDSVDQFRDIMLPQLDLRVEAHNLRRFRRDFEGETQIAFPEPLRELTSREVLVEKFVEGEPMLNFVMKEDDSHSSKDRKELAKVGLEAVMKMIFLHDFVHADLHPGNMIVDRNKNARGSPLRINMIDCGLTVELGERNHENIVKILGALIKRDGHLAGQLMVDTAKKCQATELDVELFCNGIQKICEDDEENNFLESVGDYITDICYLACKHKVKLEAAFINAALACEIMEGLAASLYPDMHVQQVALPMVLKAEMMHGLKGMSWMQ